MYLYLSVHFKVFYSVCNKASTIGPHPGLPRCKSLEGISSQVLSKHIILCTEEGEVQQVRSSFWLSGSHIEKILMTFWYFAYSHVSKIYHFNMQSIKKKKEKKTGGVFCSLGAKSLKSHVFLPFPTTYINKPTGKLLCICENRIQVAL